MSPRAISPAGPDGGDRPGGGADRPGGGAAAGPERAELERRYRRLLRCYPPSHRAVHEDEMLGVLLAAARPGQRTPGPRQTVNLAACGLAIRAHRALRWLAGPWPDALAAVSLIAPVVMLVIAALDFAAAVREQVAALQGLPRLAISFWQPTLVPLLGGPAAAMAGWLAVVLLGLTGRRRAAAAIASIPLALSLVNLLVMVVQLSGAWSGGLPMFVFTAGLVAPVVMASLAACSLAFSAGPRPGLAIVGRRRAWLVITGLSAGCGFPAIVQLARPSGSLTVPTFSGLGVLAIAVAVLVTRGHTAVKRRVAVLVVTGLMLDLASSFPVGGELAATAVLLLVSLFVAVLVWLAGIASWRRRDGRTSRAAAG